MLIWTLRAYAFVLLGCVVCASIKHRSVLNPVAFFGFFFGLQTLAAPYLLQSLGLTDLGTSSESGLCTTVGLSALYMVGLSATFCLPKSPLSGILQWLIPKRQIRLTRPVKTILFLQPILAFGVLVATSSAGTLWFTNSREAYQFGRSGVGASWSLCQAFLIAAFGAVLMSKKRTSSQVLLLSAAFGGVAYFLGSKGYVLFYIALAVFYVEHHIKAINLWKIACLAVGALITIAGLQLLQGTASTILDALTYFDYFNNTGRFISDFGRVFEHRNGQVMISDLWYYVPRSVYPQKPFTYGVTDVMETYNPGAAEQIGSTPGILPWAASYWDFGVLGVLLDGALVGLVLKAAFDLFRRRPDFWTFLLFGQFGLLNGGVQTFYNAPFLMFILWLLFEWILVAAIPNSLGILLKHATKTRRDDPPTGHVQALSRGTLSPEISA